MSGVQYCQSGGSGISPIMAACVFKYPATMTARMAVTLKMIIGVDHVARASEAISSYTRFGRIKKANGRVRSILRTGCFWIVSVIIVGGRILSRVDIPVLNEKTTGLVPGRSFRFLSCPAGNGLV